VVPGTIIDFAHVQEQVQAAIKQLHRKEIHLAKGFLTLLGLAMGEEDETIGLCGAEVEGDGSHPLGVPFGEADVGLWGLK
uniref:Uncharacterized protein n=1 Tax=Myripristis murdjan TaxID=586833 RepID=A0A667X6P3_9TELE